VPADDPGGIPGRSVDYTRLVHLVRNSLVSPLRERAGFPEDLTCELLGQATWTSLGMHPSERTQERLPLTATLEEPVERKLDDIVKLERSSVFKQGWDKGGKEASHQKIKPFSVD